MIATLFAILTSTAAPSSPLDDHRICGEPPRDDHGRIVRRADVLAAYKHQHPCPATGRSTGACPGWSVNHVIPMAAGGCDAVDNLQWLPNVIKRCKAAACVDRWERRYYGNPHGIVTLPEPSK